MNVIKCPCCGSTAQPKLIDTPKHSEQGGYYYEETYSCGCGCQFIAHFPRVCCNYTVLKEGDNNV